MFTVVVSGLFLGCSGGVDPYSRGDPGAGLRRMTVYGFDIESNFGAWEPWRTNDGRIIPGGDSRFALIENPFEQGSLIQLITYFDPAVTGKPYGGYGLRAPINPPLAVNGQTYVEFDLYYPKSAADKYMRFEIWSTSSGGEGAQSGAGFAGSDKTQVYVRTADLDDIGNLNPEWSGYYRDETWFKKSISAAVPVSTGRWEYLNIDLHTETGAKLVGDLLMIGNISITQTDPNGTPIPDVVNTKHFSEVTPIKKKYNPKAGYFLMGTIGTGEVTPNSIRGYHYELFVSGNNLKPIRHIRAPQWLDPDANGPEWNLPTEEYLKIRESGKSGEYKMHGHVLAWYNQSPSWMRRIVPESDGLFFTYGNNATGPFQKVNKNTARRVYFNHILYEMRHFMTTNERYDSSEERGIIPFHSFDVLNEEIHESRHSVIIKDNPDEWKTALKHLSWLMAMTDNAAGDIRQHYIYLLFKYAHIAVPNAQMAAKYKAGYSDPAIVPEYMKLDNHDINGSIDSYITKKPPILVYNDYDIATYSKAKVAYNMIKELNTAWRTDPLYDGRNLIECMGIQGHDTINPTLASRNQNSVRMYAALIDEGLLDWICYSELDLKLPSTAPGGGALAPAVLNQKQADVIGYQYALLFKVFNKYKKYIDHVLIWGQAGSGFQKSYVPFDHEEMASQAYYGIMNPDKFIKGHSYLHSYFDGEYAAVK